MLLEDQSSEHCNGKSQWGKIARPIVRLDTNLIISVSTIINISVELFSKNIKHTIGQQNSLII